MSQRDVLQERVDAQNRLLKQEQEKSERLLLNILPGPIANRLKENQVTIADGFADVSVMFADLSGFTALSVTVPPEVLTQTSHSRVAFVNVTGYPSPGWPRAGSPEGVLSENPELTAPDSPRTFPTMSPPLALDLDPDMTMTELLDHVSSRLRGSLVHHRFRGEDISGPEGARRGVWGYFGPLVNTIPAPFRMDLGEPETVFDSDTAWFPQVEDLVTFVSDRGATGELHVHLGSDTALYPASLANAENFALLCEQVVEVRAAQILDVDQEVGADGHIRPEQASHGSRCSERSERRFAGRLAAGGLAATHVLGLGGEEVDELGFLHVAKVVGFDFDAEVIVVDGAVLPLRVEHDAHVVAHGVREREEPAFGKVVVAADRRTPAERDVAGRWRLCGGGCRQNEDEQYAKQCTCGNAREHLSPPVRSCHHAYCVLILRQLPTAAITRALARRRTVTSGVSPEVTPPELRPPV